MLLKPIDRAYFLRFYKMTLSLVNGSEITSLPEYGEARNKLYKTKKHRLKFVPENADEDFKNAIQKAIFGCFVFLKMAKDGYYFKSDKTGQIYLISAVNEPIENYLQDFTVVHTALLPFRGKIVMDGLICGMFLLGKNYKKELMIELKEKIKNNEILNEI